MPCYADELTRRGNPQDVRLRLRSGRRRKAAAFRSSSCSRSTGRSRVAGHDVVPVPIWHGQRPILGFRFGRFAYLTDCSGIPDESWPLLEGWTSLVLDALRDRPHPTHFSLDQAVAAARRIGARRDLFHAHVPRPAARRHAPPAAGHGLAYDGLS